MFNSKNLCDQCNISPQTSYILPQTSNLLHLTSYLRPQTSTLSHLILKLFGSYV